MDYTIIALTTSNLFMGLVKCEAIKWTNTGKQRNFGKHSEKRDEA